MNHTHQIATPDSAALQATSFGTETAVADIFDRYADSIVGANRHLYDALEIHGVRNCAGGSGNETHYEIDNLNPTSFSVYVHIKGDGVECVGDFSRYSDAVQYGADLNGEYGWPVRNFVLDKHRTTLAKLQ